MFALFSRFSVTEKLSEALVGIAMKKKLPVVIHSKHIKAKGTTVNKVDQTLKGLNISKTYD